MRTFSKIALFGLAVAGLAWWLKRRRATTATFAETPSATARFDDEREPIDALVIDAVIIDELGIDEDAEIEEAVEDDVGFTSRRFVDVDQAYVGQEMGDAYALQMADGAGASTEEIEEGYRGIEAGESWLDAINVAAAEGGSLADDLDG